MPGAAAAALVLAGAAAAPSVSPALFDEMARAVSAGDARAYARLYAEDAVITIHGGDTLRGRAAIEQYEVGLLREFPGTQLRFYDAWLDGPRAVVHYGVNGRTASGQAMGHEGLLFYRFDSAGLIREERRYLDSLTPMAQLGALGPSVRPRSLPELPLSMHTHRAAGSAREAANVTLVEAALAAVDVGDEPAFLSRVAAGVVVDEMIEREPFTGADAAARWFRVWTAAVADARSEIASAVGIGDWVLMETVVRGTLRGPVGPLSATGAAFSVHRALAIEMKADRIARILAFTNGKELAQATGQWPLPSPGSR